MRTIKEQLSQLFVELNIRIGEISRSRREGQLLSVSKAKVQLLGQISLLSHDKVAATLSLAQTGDVDAFLTMDHVVKEELKKALRAQGLVYDEDSYLIWVPPGSRFEEFLNLENLFVESIDPESALVSKAVKAPEKNKILIRQAIASDAFPKLVDRILENGGRLEDFV